SKAEILDTRKTLPGWRVLDKYAVRMGGGMNHRMGLYDEVLIKDNHLAGWAEFHPGATIRDVIRRAREQARQRQRESANPYVTIPIGVEVETLGQLSDALQAHPDLVLLDNMDLPTLHQAVRLRDQIAPEVKLEASGNVTLKNVAEIAATGVDRISIGSLTHSAAALDIAFDWHPGAE
ncbi:MAG TPA: nicotinate-nucleotide diphosphorylase (carboxylating), partial [Planctomycetaceae bacterium]|nr:nicotinate-nucleotide diphosphorylase (carboxylating) [Planctomycetaceae bacterium]